MVGKKVLCGNPGLNSTIQAKVPHSFAWALTSTPRNREKRTFCRYYPTLNDFLVELQDDIYGQQGVLPHWLRLPSALSVAHSLDWTL